MRTRVTILALCLLLPALAFARTNYLLGAGEGPPIALLGSVALNAACDSVTSCTVSHTLSAGTNRKVVGIAMAEDNAATFTITGATYGGIAMTEAIQVPTPTALNRVAVFYLDEASLPANGARDFIASFDEIISEVAVAIYAVENIAQGVPKDTDNSTSDSATNATLSLTGVAATDWTFTAAVHSSFTGATWSHGTDQQERVDTVYGASAGATGSVTDEPGEAAPSSTCACSTARIAMVGVVWAKF